MLCEFEEKSHPGAVSWKLLATIYTIAKRFWNVAIKLVFFFLSGSILVSCCHFGSFVMGSDIDYTLLHGRGTSSHDENCRYKWIHCQYLMINFRLKWCSCVHYNFLCELDLTFYCNIFIFVIGIRVHNS